MKIMTMPRVAKGKGGRWFVLIVVLTMIFSIYYGEKVRAEETLDVTWSYGGVPANTDWNSSQNLEQNATSSTFDATGYGLVEISYRLLAAADSAGGAVGGYGGVTAYAKSSINDEILSESSVSPKTSSGSVVLNLNDVSGYVYIYLKGYVSGYRIYPKFTCNIVKVTPAVTATPVPTSVPIPTDVPNPTNTPIPTDNPLPTTTPIPTNIPIPTESPNPTGEPNPTGTPNPTGEPNPTGIVEPTGIPTSDMAKIIVQPTDSSVSTDKSTGFSISGNNIVSYQWLMSSNGVDYVPICMANSTGSNGVTYDGYNSPILIVSGVRLSENGKSYRCMVSGSNGEIVYSNPATMNVIDKTPPIVNVVITPKDKETNLVSVSVAAVDIDSGLHSEAYSYDNGATYLKDIKLQLIDRNGKYSVFVRDKAGNVTVKEYEIKNIADMSGNDTPTGVPTTMPTQNPTNTPTQNPTNMPTQNPTQVPTNNPTQIPTQIPTNVPTQVPIQNPTSMPTQTPVYPTVIPTYVPTVVPTQIPTNTPSKKPANRPNNSSSDKKTSADKNNDSNNSSSSKANNSSSSMNIRNSSSQVYVQTTKITATPAMNNNTEEIEIKTAENTDPVLSADALADYSNYIEEEKKPLSPIIIIILSLCGILALLGILAALFYMASIQREEGYDDDFGDIRRMYEGTGALNEDKVYRFYSFTRVRRYHGRWRVRISEEIYDQGGIRLCLGSLFVLLCEGADIDILIGDSEQSEVLQKKTEKIQKHIVIK